MEDSPLSIDKWLVAIWLIVNCKNGISSYELARHLGITQKSAWFMLHRIRLAMQAKDGGTLGGDVEADETFIGGKARFMHRDKANRIGMHRGSSRLGKVAVFGLLERHPAKGQSRVRTKIVPNVRRGSVLLEVKKNVRAGSTLYTDALKSYEQTAKWGPTDLFTHKVIDHAEKYVDGQIHTNGMENFWSLLKRSLKGTYVSVEPFHLFRYLDEQAFRFNNRAGNDAERFAITAASTFGKRLTFRQLTAADSSL
jgi:transposase-like protein